MADRSIITPELCRQLLRYEPETGKLFWEKRSLDLCKSERGMLIWNGRFAGSEAFTASDSRGYKTGAIFTAPFFAHRVIWAITSGEWPVQIDHINGDKADNRLVNLRNVSATMNMRNRTRYRNRIGLMGVYRDKASGNWRARICDIELGSYLTGRRSDCREEGWRNLHGIFANPRPSEMTLGDFLKAQGGGSWNCSTMPADWCMALGHPDYAAAWRDITDPHACEATTAHDGLLALWDQGIGDALPVVDDLEPGDIAVVALGPLEAGAIWTGERYAIRTARGLHFSDAPRLLKAWRPARG